MKTCALENVAPRRVSYFTGRQRSLLGLLLLAGFIGAPLPLSAACDTVSFRKVGPFTVDGGPLYVVTADLNGDSFKDFVTGNATTGVVVYYGDGMGGFSGPNTFPAGVYPHDVAVGDFNGDGKPDLAVAAGIDGNGSGVELLLNNGDGTFAAPTLYPAEDSPSQIVAADFNRDGILDLAVTDNISGNVDILIGTGTGAFLPPAKFAATATPAGIVVGDFNRDHKLDLAISNYGSQDLRILLGNGKGRFTVLNTYPMNGNASEVAAGDFNHDGRLDLAVGVFNIGGDDHIAVYLGNGDGSFTVGPQLFLSDPQGLVAVDLNRDGNLDLATATYASNNVTVVLGDGTGQFGAGMSFFVAAFPHDVATADFNGDGWPDLVTANYLSGKSSVLLERPCSQSEPAVLPPLRGQ
jgi:hypothetical protein